jgi:hypothetical protein
MTDEHISHLFQRMRDDMVIRRIGEKTQNDYLRQVKAFTAFVGRSPDMVSIGSQTGPQIGAQKGV